MAAAVADMKQGEDLLDLTALGKLIDTNIDQDLVNQLQQVDILNTMFKADIYGNEELIPVGSCVDGSKVTLPGDSGDVDVLIMSNRIILTESLFDYDKERPAFLHIRVNGDHEKYFKTVKDPINGIYLPTTILKELKEKMFFVSKIFLKCKIHEGISKDGKFLNLTRTSAVGKEQIKLCPNDENNLSFPETTYAMEFKLKRMENFARNALVGIMDLVCQNEAPDDEVGMQTRKRHTKLLQEHEKMSLSELLNKFLGIMKELESTGRFTRDSLKKKIDNKEDNSGDEISARSNSPDNEHNKCDKSSSSNEFPRRDVIYKRKHSQADISLKETKIRNTENDPKTGGIKNDAAFSIAKSTDYVPAYKFDGWPRVADEWLTRSRKWPSKETIKSVLKAGCQVVAKRPLVLCNTPIPEEKDPYFRLSFALSEIILAKSMKEQQRLCWRILKMYQKCYLQTRPKFLTSYHWKNILFWVSESTEESFWTDENVSEAVQRCLYFMSECLQNRNLPFYFVRKMNMFEGCEVTLFESLGRRVEEIRCSPVEFLKRSITEPPVSQVYFIDKGEISAMLSQEGKAHAIDKVMEAMVEGFTSNFTSFNIDKSNNKLTPEVMLQLLKKASSDKKENSSDEAHNSDKELFMKKFEDILVSMKNEDVGGISRSMDDLIQAGQDSISRANEKDTDSDRGKKERVSHIFEGLRTGFAELFKKEGGSSEMFQSFHKVSTLMQEDFEHECDENGDDKNTKGNKIFSTILSGFPKFMKAIQKNEEESGNRSFSEDFRNIFGEISQKINTISEKAEEPKREYDMDIDLD